MAPRRVAVIMAGGSGTRFWPVSTPERPKQFLRLASPKFSLLEQSVDRIRPLVGDDLYVATSEALVCATSDLLPGVGADKVLGEPVRRNTLGALVWATANLMADVGDLWREISVAVLTADHLISPEDAFRHTVAKALTLAENEGALVTIGIPPSRPATEYGYIEFGEPIAERAWRAKRFTEKPEIKTAGEFVASGRFLWNSGMFFWTLATFYDELRRAQPAAAAVLDDVAKALTAGDMTDAAQRFSELHATSIDYALMENAHHVAVVAAEFAWDDLGSWDSLSRSLPQDADGNVAQGDVRFVDAHGCVVYSESQQNVTVLGLEDVVVAVTEGYVMVSKKDRSQDVRKLAD